MAETISVDLFSWLQKLEKIGNGKHKHKSVEARGGGSKEVGGHGRGKRLWRDVQVNSSHFKPNAPDLFLQHL